MKQWVLCALALGVSFSSLEAANAQATPPSQQPVSPPNSESNLWPQYFNPQTSEDRTDTDTETDEDVIIMEEDEESEHVPGNAENETG